MKGQKVLFSTRTKDDWGSPKAIVWWANEHFGPFTIDLAADASNRVVCEKWYDEASDSLKQNWVGENGWLNFPYSQGKKFIKKTGQSIIEARNLGFKENNPYPATKFTLLAPVRTSNQEWHDVIFELAEEIVFIKGRLTFEGAENCAPFPSALIHFNSNPSRRWQNFNKPIISQLDAKKAQKLYSQEGPG